jgi:broad specificity phosphatase PhoE
LTPAGTTNVLLVRHGESEGNARGVMQGRREYPLSEHGRQQVRCLARWMREQRVGWDVAYCSPLSRTLETAALLASELNLAAAIVEPALIELDAGELEGLDLAGMRARFPGFDQRPVTTRGDFADYGGEAYEQLNARIAGFRCRLEEYHRDSGETVLVVGHGGALYQLLKQLVCIPVPRIANLRFGNCSITRVRLREQRGTYLGDVIWHVPVELMGAGAADGPGGLF